ncbi:MAG: TonB-dependent receptor [Alphaproteobacteria bacterium]|nr:TonB-dependent receptor [Alphaproteobacteria bacterium]
MSRFLLSVSALALLATPAFADQPVEKVVVTASRIGKVAEDRLGTAVTIIDGKQIEDRQTRFVGDVLRDVPGVTVSRSGAVGSKTQVRMRGAEGNHTLVMFDGADVSDPFQGEFDFSGLLATDIERIEILRGSQSALYGSDAIGGVVNIVPRRGKGDFAVEAMGEGGSFATWQTGMNASVGNDTFDFYASANHHATAGINIARDGSERDGERDSALFVNAGLRPVENVELRAFLRYVDTFAETDPQNFFSGLVVDGSDDTFDTTQLYGNISAEVSAFAGAWQSRLNYAFIDADSTTDSAFGPFTTKGDRRKVSLVSAVNATTGALEHKLTGAIDWRAERYQNVATTLPFDPGINGVRKLDTIGYALSYDLSIDAFDAGIAFRRDDNDRFDDANTYRLQASYRLSDTTRLRATAGTGVKNPNNFELFGFDPSGFVGNPNLKPEKSTGWDVGIDQTFWSGKARATATYFEARLKNEIETTFVTTNNAAGVSKRRGVELTLDVALADDLTLNAAYTHLDADQAGAPEIRRAPHIASLNLNHRFLDRASATLSVRYNGEQDDTLFSFFGNTPVVNKAFTLVNVNASYDLTDNIQVFGRVENLFDEKYEEVFSYRSPGIAAYAGIRTKF